MTIKIKDTIKFGKYNWQVLDVEDNKALLLLDGLLKKLRFYHDKQDYVTWETCKLREWLNEKWLNRKFSSEDKDCILEVANANNDNFRYDIKTDKVFLLSIDEYELYRGIINNAVSWWWLRSPGAFSSRAAYVRSVGDIFMYGNYVSSLGGGVRPALWLDIEFYKSMEV